MRAALLNGAGEPLTIEEVELAAPGPSEVVVTVAAAGLCRSDLHVMDGRYDQPLPLVPGHESAGVVAAVGAAVTHVAPGDRVVTCLSAFCGDCRYCRAGRTNLCDNLDATRGLFDARPRLTRRGDPVHQLFGLGSFAEQVLVHENAVVKITGAIPLDRAALLGCAVTTGLGAVFNTAGVRAGETVAVIGCGGVGLSVVQGARIAGAELIVAVDPVPEKHVLARALGATHAVAAVDEVRELTGGRGVDHAFEAIGLPEVAEAAFAMLAKGGALTVVGMMPPGTRIRLPADGFLYEQRIQGSLMGSNRFRTDIPRYVAMYLEGLLRLDEMVTARLDLAGINAGFDAMRRGLAARSVIVF